MRRVGDITGERAARRFAGVLAANGIEAEVRPDDGDVHGVWVLNEDDMDRAEDWYRRYQAAPDAKEFAVEPAPAKAAPSRARNIDVRREIFQRRGFAQAPVTFTLITLSVVATLLTAANRDVFGLMYYSLAAIADGQVWRLVTPIFFHGGIIHLLFNMLWLHQLGGAIENIEGKWYLLGIVLVTAVVCNTAQFFVSGPNFLGFSGVVYALFGYVWMMARYKAGTRYAMDQSTVVIMIFWLVICIVAPALVGPTANTEHVAGILQGVAFGWLRSGHITTMRRRKRFRG